MGKPYHAVILVTVPADWRPSRVFHLPPTFTEARFYSRRLPLGIAIEVAKSYNRDRMHENPIGTWAFTIRALKTLAYGSPDSRQQLPNPNSRRSMLRRQAEGGGI